MPEDLLSETDPRARARARCDELRRAILSGEPFRAETYVEAYRGLDPPPDEAIELILVEYEARRQRGEPADVEEECSRFPEWREYLRRQFMVLGALNERAEQTTSIGATAPAQARCSGETGPDMPQLGPHELLEKLGGGGMGVVYRARDLVLHREVALKMMQPDCMDGPGAVERFYREAQAVASLRHPNVVPIHCMGTHHGRHCFTMQLLHGGTLSRPKAPLATDLREIVAFMEKVARGVQAAHERGIVHRDLKPANVLLDERGEPLVADFGLAKVPGGHPDATRPGERLGTPSYMSPEQAAGHSWKATAAGDVWALGVMLYELTTGQRPFAGLEADEVLGQVLTAKPKPPRVVRPDLPVDLERIIMRCLQKQPEQRYACAGLLADALRNWLDGHPAHAPARPKRRARVTVLMLAAGTLLLASLVGLGAAFLGHRHPQRPTAPATPGPMHLVNATALPASAGWSLGEGSLNVPGNDSLVVKATPRQLSLFQLLDRPPWQRFRFSARVKHLGKREGAVGLYIDHSPQPAGEPQEHWFVAVTFTERPTVPPANIGGPIRAGVGALLYRYQPTTPARRGFVFNAQAAPHRVFDPSPGEWRNLTLEVTSDSLLVYYGEDAAPCATVVWQRNGLEMAKNLARLPPAGPAPVFTGTGPLGIICDEGEAVFQDLVAAPF